MCNRPNPLRFRLVLPFVLYLASGTGVTALAPSCVDAQDEAGDTTRRWSETLKMIRTRFPDVTQISTETLQTWFDKSPKHENLILLDVREPDEFAVSHLQGARRAPSKGEVLNVLRGRPPNQRIVLYCSVGYRSSELAGFLMTKGFAEVYNLEGSIFRWANEGRPVYRGNERVRVVHPYDRSWGRLLKKHLRQVDTDVPTAPRATPQ